MNWHDFLDWRIPEIIGLVVATVALVIGVYHLVEIRRAVHELDELQKVASTRYLGKFPFFVDALVEMLESARNDIAILCDFPGYADFSHPSAGLRYRHVLEEKRDAGIKVTVICLDEQSRTDYLNQQFPANEWDNWKEDPAKAAMVSTFLTSRGEHRSDITTREDLFRVMHEADRQTLRQAFTTATADAQGPMPVYFWIVDGRRAVFSISTLAAGAVEHGFATADPAFIDALRELVRRYRRELALSSA